MELDLFFNQTYLLFVIFLTFGIVGFVSNILSEYREKISYISAGISVFLFIILLLLRIDVVNWVSLKQYIGIILSIFIASLAVAIASQYSLEKEMEANMRGRQYYIGAVLKSFAISLILNWVLFKLILFPSEWLPSVFYSIDSLLGSALIAYILGAGFESVELNGTLGVLGGFFKGLATSSIFALILSCIFQWIGVVKNWQIIHEFIFNTALVSIIISIILYSALPQRDRYLQFRGPSSKRLKLRVLFRDVSIYPHEKMSLRVSKESIFVPLKIGGYIGGYIQGDIEYKVNSELKKVKGRADEILILARERLLDDIYENSEEIEKEDFIFREIDRSEIVERINSILSEIKERKKSGVVKLPFVSIIESDEFDYVKAGPVTIYDFNEGGSYVKIGPIKIIDGDVDGIFKLAYIIIRDLDRGLIKIVTRGNRLVISTPGEKIKLSSDYEEYLADGKRVRIMGDKISVRVNNTKIILEDEEKAIIKKPDKKIIADGVSGTLTIITSDTGKKVLKNKEQALKTVNRVRESVLKIIKETLKEPEIDEVKGLISYLDELLGKR